MRKQTVAIWQEKVQVCSFLNALHTFDINTPFKTGFQICKKKSFVWGNISPTWMYQVKTYFFANFPRIVTILVWNVLSTAVIFHYFVRFAYICVLSIVNLTFNCLLHFWSPRCREVFRGCWQNLLMKWKAEHYCWIVAGTFYSRNVLYLLVCLKWRFQFNWKTETIATLLRDIFIRRCSHFQSNSEDFTLFVTSNTYLINWFLFLTMLLDRFYFV